jgi:tetratricopeptide (TPR) repeat protein
LFAINEQKKLAYQKYNGARSAISNPYFGEERTDRIESAINEMDNAGFLFEQIGDKKMMSTCKGYVLWWRSQKEWKEANKILTAEALTIREKALELLCKALEYFEESKKDKETKEAHVSKYYYLGIIAQYKLNTQDARLNFREALEISKKISPERCVYLEAQLKECDGWELAINKYEKHEQNISGLDIANKFQEALQLYRQTSDTTSITYLEGWIDLFLFESSPDKSKSRLRFQSFRSKTIPIENKRDIRVDRWRAKIDMISEHQRLFEWVKPFLVKNEFEILAEDLGDCLRDMLLNAGWTKSETASLEKCYNKFVKTFGVKNDPSLDWLIDWRHRSKHEIHIPEKYDFVINDALTHEGWLDTLPATIEEFKVQADTKLPGPKNNSANRKT